MTHRQEVGQGAASREIAARWCALAEQRLEHLSEMFETGRWRRYHSELAFLENIQEAKRAVQTWRALANGRDVAAAAASVTSAFGWSPATMSRPVPSEQAQTLQPKAVHIAPETSVPVRLEPKLDMLAEITEAPIAPLAEPIPVGVAALMASFTAPAEMPLLKAPAARAPGAAPAVRSPVAAPVAAAATRSAPAVKPPVAAPAAMATLLPQFTPPAEEIVAAPERVVEFTFSLDGLEAKYPLLRNSF
ncbi:TIGR03809 family protein [Bradyrhizobium manausense]|uniref:TIGR03809 family protein n=1 Tax=Bradyrhizobium manausense TaxID=989370 RepID=UPI001BAA4144|nr:TIGR03809 family protein [Bradyrhizobium manausense]MBR1087326.1 TIGR03809 family protein [Bradyrhizobium manausense]